MKPKETQLSYRYKRLKSANPYLGNLMILSMAVRGMKYPQYKIFEAFNKYIPKGDYALDQREDLMKGLVVVTNRPSEEIRGLTEPLSKVKMNHKISNPQIA